MFGKAAICGRNLAPQSTRLCEMRHNLRVMHETRFRDRGTLAIHAIGNSTMASPVATFSPAWLHTMTSISTQRDLCVVCFDLMMPLG